MLQLRRRGKGNRIPNVVAAGTGTTPAAFYLGLCRLRGILSPPASATVILQEGRSSAQLRWCCRRAVLSCSSDDAASIPKSGPEIKNRCTKEGVNGENRAAILKSGLEFKNRRTQEGLNREILATIPKSGPEIKNRCTKEGVNREKLASIRKSKPEIKNRCSKGHQNILQPKTISPRPSAPNHQSSSGNGTGLPSAGLKGMGLPHSRSLSERIVASSAHF